MYLKPHALGFSLIEVMVALIVISVGLLGIAKLEALALSSTTTASNRSLAALQASSLAAAMHVNRGYWSQGDASGATVTAVGTTIAVSSGLAPNLTASLAAGPVCTSTVTPCSVSDLAAYDLTNWVGWLQAVLPNTTTVVACGTAPPVSCTIRLTWNESSVATNSREVTAKVNNGTTGTTADFENSAYTLYVQP